MGEIDWVSLGFYDAPVKGDVSAIEAYAGFCGETHQMIQTSEDRLRRVATGQGKGVSIDKIRDTAGQVAGQLAQVKGRFARAAEVLGSFAPVFTGHKNKVEELGRDAMELLAAKKAAEEATVPPSLTAPGASDEVYQDAVRELEGKFNAAREGLESKRQAIVTECDNLSEAASVHAGRLEEITQHDAVKNSFWDNVSEGWAEFLKVMKTVLDVVGAALAVLAVVGMFFTGLGAVVAAIAFAVTLAQVAVTGLLVMAGEGTGADIRAALLGFVPGGAGRLIGAGLKGAKVILANSKSTTKLAGVFRGGPPKNNLKHRKSGQNDLRGQSPWREMGRDLKPFSKSRETMSELRKGGVNYMFWRKHPFEFEGLSYGAGKWTRADWVYNGVSLGNIGAIGAEKVVDGVGSYNDMRDLANAGKK